MTTQIFDRIDNLYSRFEADQHGIIRTCGGLCPLEAICYEEMGNVPQTLKDLFKALELTEEDGLALIEAADYGEGPLRERMLAVTGLGDPI